MPKEGVLLMKRFLCCLICLIVVSAVTMGGESSLFLNTVYAATPQLLESGLYSPLMDYMITDHFIPNRPNRTAAVSTSAHLACDMCPISDSADWSVMSIYPGEVVQIYNDNKLGCGRYIKIKHNIGGIEVYSLYQHLKANTLTVSVGQQVKGGEVIAQAGQSGNSSETFYDRHLHIIIYSGRDNPWTDRRLTEYKEDTAVDGPITYQGTTYYNPKKVLDGSYVIGNGSYKPRPIDPIEPSNSTVVASFAEVNRYRTILPFRAKKSPLSSAKNGKWLLPGKTVETKRGVINRFNNLWFELSNGQYVYSGYKAQKNKAGEWEFVQSGTQYFAFKDAKPAEVTWKGNNLSGKSLKPGKSFEIKGSIISKNQMTRIVAEVYNGDSRVGSPITMELNNVYELDLLYSKINTGIKFAALPAMKNGKLVLTITYRAAAGTKTETKTITAKFKIEDNTKNQAPRGYVDFLSGGHNSLSLSGWAYDPDDVSAKVELQVYGNGRLLGKGTANLYRADVGQVFPGAGSYHGYSFSLNNIPAGSYRIDVYAIDPASGGKTKLTHSSAFSDTIKVTKSADRYTSVAY